MQVHQEIKIIDLSNIQPTEPINQQHINDTIVQNQYSSKQIKQQIISNKQNVASKQSTSRKIGYVQKNKPFTKYEFSRQNPLESSRQVQLSNQNGKFLTQLNYSYKQWKVYKNKPLINMIPFPYCYQPMVKSQVYTSPLQLYRFNRKQKAQIPSISLPHSKIYHLKVQNKVQSIFNIKKSSPKLLQSSLNYEKAPINQYLNYQLSEDINIGLRDVKIVAEEIKNIKLQKKLLSGNNIQLKGKENKQIRITKAHIKNYRGLYKTQSEINRF